MAIAYKETNGAASWNPTIQQNSRVVDFDENYPDAGDLLIAIVRIWDQGDSSAPMPSVTGFSTVSSYSWSPAGDGFAMKIAWMVATGSETSMTVTWIQDGDLLCHAMCLSFSGASRATATVGSWVTKSNVTSHPSSGITTSVDDAYVCSALAGGVSTTEDSSRWTVGSPFSEHREKFGTLLLGGRSFEGYSSGQSSGTCTQDSTSSDYTATVQFELAPIIIGEATLQGVATLPAIGNVGVASATAEFQGVATLDPEGQYIAGGRATLQGVGRILQAEPEGVPFLDFTKYDFYLEALGECRGFCAYRDQATAPTTQSVPLQPARQDVGNNPMEMRPESGDYYSQGDFSQGSGQSYYHREGRDPKAFAWSEGFDISEPGKLTHLHAVAEAYDNASASVLAQSAGVPFVAVGTKVRKGDGNFPGSWSEEDPQSSGTDDILDMCSAGDVMFVALDGTGGIHKRSNAGSWSHFSDSTATKIAYVFDRLVAVETDGDIVEINMGTGVAGTAWDTLAAGWTAEDIFEAGGFIHVVIRSANEDRSRILHFGLKADLSAIEKKGSTPFPQGQQMYSGAGYLDKAYIGGGVRNPAGGYDPILYEAYVDTDKGHLTYSVVAEDEGSGSYSYPVRAIAALGESVLFGWTLTTGSRYGVARDGIAKFDLARQAFAHHLKKLSAGGANVTSILVYKGRALFVLDGDGLYYEDTSGYVPTAWLIPSLGDWGNAGQKAWDVAQIAHAPLATGTSLKLYYSTVSPEETSTWSEVLVSSVVDAVDARASIGATSRLLSLKIESYANGTGTAAPTLLSYSVKSYPTVLEDPEYRLTRVVRLLRRDRRNKQAPDVFLDPQEARAWLQSIAHRKVNLHEPGASWSCRIEEVSDVFPERPPFAETRGETGRDFYIVQLTMRGTR